MSLFSKDDNYAVDDEGELMQSYVANYRRIQENGR